MVTILREADEAPVAEVARKRGICAQTIDNWRQHFGGLPAVDATVRQLRPTSAALASGSLVEVERRESGRR
jgi:putative transposase